MAQEQLQIIINSQAKGKGAQDAKKGLDTITEVAKFAAGAFAALKTAQAAIDFVKFGAGVQRQATALDGLAKSAGSSGAEITAAIQSASHFTIDRMTAMSAASKAMMLDVAKTPEQFERLTKVSTALGRAMGQDAAKSIDDFVVAAGRQSMMIADNLGLTIKAENAYARYAKQLGKTAGELTSAEKKQAFLNEMLVEGERKMAEMGDASDDTAGAIEMLEAAAKDASVTIAQKFSQALLVTVGSAEAASDSIRAVGEMLGEATGFLTRFFLENNMVTRMLPKAAEGYQDIKEWLDKDKDALDQNITGYNGYRTALSKTTEFTLKYANAIDHVNYISEGRIKAMKAWRPTQAQIEKAILDTIEALEEEAEATKKAKEKVDELAEAQRQASFEMGMAFTDFYRRGREQAADFAEQREQIEADHQERLADLRAKGQASAIQIDAEAEEEKLATLKRRLEIALQQQAEFTDKTKESQRMAKETTIANLQTQIGKQEQLLSDFYGGRLIQQGQNISAELTAEQTRYDEELQMLDENRAAQEELQKQSLGRMMLQWFESWLQMNEMSSEKAMEMRIAIAKEYGLLDEAGARTTEALIGGLQAYADGSITSAETVIKQMNAVKAAVENLPTHKTITIEARVDEIVRRGGGWQEQFPGEEVAGPTPQESAVPREGETTPTTPGTRPRTPTPEAPSSPFEMQHGGYVPYGGLYSVGEAGREMVALPGGSYVFNATETAQMLRRISQETTLQAGGARIQRYFDELRESTDHLNDYLLDLPTTMQDMMRQVGPLIEAALERVGPRRSLESVSSNGIAPLPTGGMGNGVTIQQHWTQHFYISAAEMDERKLAVAIKKEERMSGVRVPL